MNLPKDPVILLGYVNTQLRDFYPSLDSFCEENELEKSKITDLLSSIDYEYDAGRNQFI